LAVGGAESRRTSQPGKKKRNATEKQQKGKGKSEGDLTALNRFKSRPTSINPATTSEANMFEKRFDVHPFNFDTTVEIRTNAYTSRMLDRKHTSAGWQSQAVCPIAIKHMIGQPAD
jgi:hypothetical protein